MKYSTTALILLINLLISLGCARSLEGDVYSRDEAQRTMQIQWATVVDTKPVVIEGDRSRKGQMAGAVIGGAAGHSATESRSQGLATAVGAVAGAIVGEMTEEKMTRAQGLEITLKMEGNGETIVIVQEVDDVDDFAAGDRVKLVSGSGKLHVTK